MLDKKQTINSASTACNSSVFELYDEKKVLIALYQKQKALVKILHIKSNNPSELKNIVI